MNNLTKLVLGLIVVLVLIGIVLIISTPNSQEKVNEIEVKLAQGQALKGVGVSPKSFIQKDYLAFLEQVQQTQDVLVWSGDWNELRSQQAPDTIAKLAGEYGYEPIIIVTPFDQGNGELLRPLNTSNKQRYRDYTLEFIRKYQPRYFGIGLEVNVLAEKNADASQQFISFYNQIYQDIKQEFPETKVFTTFQLENSGWEMISRFQTDLAAFTTYPSLVFRTPQDIPDNHYRQIVSNLESGIIVDKPLAFIEIGWHAGDAPGRWASTEEAQSQYIEKFLALTAGLDVELAVWSFMYDQDVLKPFDSMGLITNEGQQRLAWEGWVKW